MSGDILRLPLPPPPDQPPEHHDLRELILGFNDWLIGLVRSAVASRPTRVEHPDVLTANSPGRFALALERVRGSSSRLLRGPANPINRDPDGYEYRSIPGSAWAPMAALTQDQAAMAFCLASEAPDVNRYPQYALAIGDAIMAESEAVGLSPHARITMDGVQLAGRRRAKAAGHYGRQSGRWCASLRWPTLKHVTAAMAAMAGPRLLVRDARRWADLRIMDRGYQAGKRLKHDALSLMRKRAIEGWEWIGPVVRPENGEQVLDPFVLCLWRWRGPGYVDAVPGLDMVAEGRRRWKIRSRD